MAQAGWKDRASAMEEAKQSLHQKEALTTQMIGIVSSRLDALQVLANNRKLGLESDLRVHSSYCSKLVPGLQDPYENRAASSGKAKPSAGAASASNQAMMERLFGADDKTRTRTVLKKKKIELHKGEHRRNVRAQMEKQLQASIEGHITRSVDGFTYAGADADNGLVVHTRLLLMYTYERMHISRGRRAFKRFLLSELSTTLFDEIFWLVFCHLYQRRSDEQQHALVDSISSRYVKMLASLQANMDFLFRIYPYAVASGVCWGFHYVFPGSRHLYSPDFKNEVYLFVCQLLLGLKLCATSVQSMRREFFPDEVLEDALGKAKLGAQAKPSTAPDSAATELAKLPSIARSASVVGLPSVDSITAFSGNAGGSSMLHKSASESSYAVRLEQADNSIAKILEHHEGNREPDVPRRRQQRALFNAAQLSPLLKDYFNSPTKSVKKPYFLLRTSPSPACSVGGEDTYHKRFHRKGQPNFAADAQRQHEKCHRELQKLQRDARRDIDAINERRDLVLGSGKAGVQAYCSLLLSAKSATDDSAEVASSTASAAAVAPAVSTVAASP